MCIRDRNSIDGLDRPIINLGYGVLNEDGTITELKTKVITKEIRNN